MVIDDGEFPKLKIDHDYVSGTYRRSTLSQGKTVGEPEIADTV